MTQQESIAIIRRQQYVLPSAHLIEGILVSPKHYTMIHVCGPRSEFPVADGETAWNLLTTSMPEFYWYSFGASYIYMVVCLSIGLTKLRMTRSDWHLVRRRLNTSTRQHFRRRPRRIEPELKVNWAKEGF